MPETAKIQIGDINFECPIIKGTENEIALDIGKLRSSTGYITLDEGFANTGACKSSITFIDGEQGILRYRGYPIEQLAEHSRFIEVAWLIIWGELPTKGQLNQFSSLLTEYAPLHTSLEHHFDGFPKEAHPMAILSAMLNAVSCYDPDLLNIKDENQFVQAAAKIISKVRTIAAYSYRSARGYPFNYPHPKLKYCANFLHMMFSFPYEEYKAHPDIEKALNLFFILHADHGQNCSASTVRMVGSAKADLFSSVSAGVCALWGSLHGGANSEVIKMLEDIHKTGKDPQYYIDLAKSKESNFKLMGFGHRIYKSFDPRAKILKEYVDKALNLLNKKDPLLDIAKKLEELALSDPYYIERKLYPNVDFYSGILLRAMGIPNEMFTVLFAIGRIPGWIAHWKEVLEQGEKISRPRQIYTGHTIRDYVPMKNRG
ncbi:MAG: citrate synthase [Candidatus Aureabacteria bacterium]|nr:citrate synthase [Candidatus Auribacterota bacterium]